jgi:type IV pilus assembly protein PilY1
MVSPGVAQADLLDTTAVTVYEGNTSGNARVSGVTGVNYFSQLEALFDYDFTNSIAPIYNGWYIDLTAQRERNLGRAALLGEVLTFTSYIPSSDICETEGISNLYAMYYRTGTAYWKSIIGQDSSNQVVEGGETKSKNVRQINLGRGLALSPNIFRGRKEGSKAFIQTSTGEIKEIEEINPGIVKSGKASWKQVN